eukprot:CAMPEP_0181487544 /NCGR_PEP_ID=MMETSP1110-20121109/47873_1 /TAXON_ID=174948 /ORGANISM="Symbiodinium sp., Strain CCMP421" /LENGTH=294 /DNA_ID=CAMNT_0023614053 /DNA_START=247 /DNA_END=1128 /DNA_ORIENTATION=-
MVTATSAQVPGALHTGATAENVVHATMRIATEHAVHALGEFLDGWRSCDGVEVANKDHVIIGLCVFANYPHDVVCSGLTSAFAAAAQRKRAVEVQKKHCPAVLSMLHSNPLHSSLAVPLIPPVFRNVRLPPAKLLPCGFAVGHAQRMGSLNSRVLVLQSSVMDDALNVITFLEAHEVVGIRPRRGCNEPSTAPTFASSQAEQIPPEKVVRQDLRSQATLAAQRPGAVWNMRAAPLMSTNDNVTDSPKVGGCKGQVRTYPGEFVCPRSMAQHCCNQKLPRHRSHFVPASARGHTA